MKSGIEKTSSSKESDGPEQERLESYADLSNGWFWETDANHCFTYMSRSVERLVGVPPEWHYGKSRAELGGQDLPPTVWQSHLQDLAARRPFRDFVFQRTSGDQVIWMRTNGVPLFDRNGTFVGYRGFASNVSDEMLVRREAELLREAVDQITEPFIIWGIKDELVICNDAARKLNAGHAHLLKLGNSFSEIIRGIAYSGSVLAARGREEEWIAQRERQHRLDHFSYKAELEGDRFVIIHEQKLSSGARAWFGIDVSQQTRAERRTEELHRRLHDAIEALPHGFCYFDSEDRLLLFNKRYEDYLALIGVTPKKGLRFEDSLHQMALSGAIDLPAEGAEEWVQSQLARRRSKPVVRIERKLGDKWIQSTESLTSDGGRVGLRMDISELKEQEAELRRAREEAEIANSAKSMFLANMSHEIRTPLNGVIGLARLLADTPLDDKQQNYMRKIETASESLLSIINDVLDFSKIEAGEMTVEEVDFSLVDEIRRLNDIIALKAAEKGLQFSIDIDPHTPVNLIGDPVRVFQILLNFLTNAVKFTEHGYVGLKIEPKEVSDEGASLHFAVRDSGIGMTEEQARSVFSSFSQADTSTTRRFGGTGLGLSICSSLAELLGGSIWVESCVGEGSVFHLELPFEIGTGSFQGSDEGLDTVALGRVLIADDNPTARLLMENMLSAMGADCTIVVDGKAAVDAAATNGPFDLVLLDWRMPEMDGISACRAICEMAKERGQAARVLLFSADKNVSVLERALAAGAKGVLAKPISWSELCDSISAMLTNKNVAARHDRKPKSGERAQRFDGVRALLVEDNAINREIAVAVLSKAGVDVTEAENGAVAVEMLITKGPDAFDIVLMDLQMPVMGGYEATLRIRSDPDFDHIPIIAMTANALSDEKENCLAVGMQDHVSKPVDNRKLFAALARWCTGQSKKTATTAKHPSEMPPAATIVEEGTMSEPNGAGDADSVDISTRYEPFAKMIGDASMVGRFLSQFRDSFGGARAVFDGHVAAGELQEIERYAHQIKGVAGNLRLNDIFMQAEIVERRFKDPDASAAERGQDLEKLLQLLEVEIGFIDRFMAENA